MHGWGTVVNCQSVGSDFCVGQNVTIGWSKSGRPIIGDHVTVYAGAIVVGGVKLFDNCVIAAGAVVTKDVEENTMVAGNPAKVIKVKDKDNNWITVKQSYEI